MGGGPDPYAHIKARGEEGRFLQSSAGVERKLGGTNGSRA